jgi:hypothetical protein
MTTIFALLLIILLSKMKKKFQELHNIESLGSIL